MTADPLPAAAVVVGTTASPGRAATLGEELWGTAALLPTVIRRLPPLEAVVVVLRNEEQATMLDGLDHLTVIIDPEWHEGGASPLRAALDWLTQCTDLMAAFIVALDTPETDPGVFAEMLEAHDGIDGPVTVPKYRYTRGGPILLDRAIWPRLLGAEGDLELDQLLLAHPQWVREVRVDRAPPRRIASAADLAELGS